MRRARPRLVAMVAAMTAFSALATSVAAGQAGAGTGRRTDGTLTIGNLAPDTGELSTIVQSLRVPVALALQEVNQAGGVGGKPVTLVSGDDATPEVAETTLQRMVDTDQVDAIIGPASSSITLTLLDDIRRAGVLTCSGSNTAADLSRAPTKGLYFRTAPSDVLQARALAQLVVSERHKRVAILTSNDAYGKSFRPVLRDTLKDGGAKVVADFTYRIGATKPEREVKRIAKKKPKALLVVGMGGDGVKVMQTLITLNLGPKVVPTFTSDGLLSGDFAATVSPTDPSAVDGIRGTTPAAAPAGVESPFDARYAATGTELVFSSYHYYDCTILEALAAVKAKSDNPAKMKKAFAANLHGKKSCDTFADCKKLLERGRTIHWRGASSQFERYGTNEPREAVFDLWSYDGGGKVQTQDSSAQIRV